MDAQDLAADCRVRQIDEEDLVEPALADQLRRQRRDVVGRRDDEDLRFALGQPRQEGAEHPARNAAVAVAGRQAFLDFVYPQHARRHDAGRCQRLAQVALRLADVLVVDRAEVQPQQRHTVDAGCGARRDALAAALHAEQQHALRRLQLRRGAVERRLAQLQPVLQVQHAAQVGELRGVVLEAEHATAIEQFVLGLHHRRQVARHERAVVEDRLAGQPLSVADRQAAEVLDQQLQRFAVGGDLAAVRARPVAGDFLDDSPALDAVRKRQPEARGEMLQLARQRHLVADQNDRARLAVIVLADVLHQPHVHRVGEEGMEVEQDVDAADVRGADRLQHRSRLGIVLLRAAQIYVQAPQAVGDGPLEYRRVRGGETRRQRGEQLERSRLVARLDHHQRHAAAKQRFELLARVGR